MKAKEIEIGGRYIAKISGRLVTVRVDEIREVWAPMPCPWGRSRTVYDVTNLATGRRTTFRSPQKFRRHARYEIR